MIEFKQLDIYWFDLESSKDFTLPYGIAYDNALAKGIIMNILKATEARTKLYTLIDEAAETHQPISLQAKEIMQY